MHEGEKREEGGGYILSVFLPQLLFYLEVLQIKKYNESLLPSAFIDEFCNGIKNRNQESESRMYLEVLKTLDCIAVFPVLSKNHEIKKLNL